MASDLQRSPTRPVQQNHADSNDFGDLISPETPSVVSSRIMQARGGLDSVSEAKGQSDFPICAEFAAAGVPGFRPSPDGLRFPLMPTELQTGISGSRRRSLFEFLTRKWHLPKQTTCR
jgi:hypothetical protein